MSDLGEWDDEPAVSDQHSEPLEAVNPEAEEATEPELFYKDLVSFVQEHLSPSYRRSLSGTDRTWCPSWWKHEEAISRLEALWRSWEFLRLDGSTGMGVWWRDHADHHMGVLLSADGPFKGCKPVSGGTRPTSSKLSRVIRPPKDSFEAPPVFSAPDHQVIHGWKLGAVV